MAFFKLLKGGTIFSPKNCGTGDVLIAGERIAAIGKDIDISKEIDCEQIDVNGMSLSPGFIDLHVHIIGGGGEAGPASRLPEISIDAIVRAGVTTVLGVLGTDGVTRSTEALVAKAQGLEQQGITAFALSGSYTFPHLSTLTGSLQKDITFIPQIIGVGELAISDHRAPHATFDEFVRVVSDARIGGLIGGKPGLVVIHMGHGREKMAKLFRMIAETEIPINQVLPTHVTKNRELFDDAVRFASMGGNIDITAREDEKGDKLRLVQALDILQDHNIPMERVSVSTDSNGSLPRFDQNGRFIDMKAGTIATLNMEFRRLIADGSRTVSDILPLFTTNPAARLGLTGKKGVIAVGGCADITLFDDNWNVATVFARGRQFTF